MVKASIWLVIILFAVLATSYGQDSAKAKDDWIRIAGVSQDFSVVIPSAGYLVNNEEVGSHVWYFEKGVSLIVTMEKRRDAKSIIKRWASLTEDGSEKHKYFESGDSLIRQYIYSDDPDENRLSLSIASPRGLYYVSASVKRAKHAIFERFANSIQLDGKPLFGSSPPTSGAPVTIPIKSLETTEIILQALKRPDSRTSGYRIDQARTLPVTDKREFSRGLVLLRKPRAAYNVTGRHNVTKGSVKLSIAFLASGQVGDITVLGSLARDLDEEAFRAARKIKFLAAEIDGKPVDTVRVVEYTFTLVY